MQEACPAPVPRLPNVAFPPIPAIAHLHLRAFLFPPVNRTILPHNKPVSQLTVRTWRPEGLFSRNCHHSQLRQFYRALVTDLDPRLCADASWLSRTHLQELQRLLLCCLL